MPKLTMRQIEAEVDRRAYEQPEGIRWMETVRQIHSGNEETPVNSVRGAVHQYVTRSEDYIKIYRGMYQRREFYNAALNDNNANWVPPLPALETFEEIKNHQPIVEADFYPLFATWLVDEAEDATAAVPLGGNVLGQRWGTPDVIGVMRSLPEHMLRFDTEIVSAEIKIDQNQFMVGLGQAVSYRLFSHRTYLAISQSAQDPDFSRLRDLCSIVGVGLVTFNLSLADPGFRLVIPARTTKADRFWVNQTMDRLRHNVFAAFRGLSL